MPTTSSDDIGAEYLKFITDAYSAEELRDQATQHNRYVKQLKISKDQKKTKMVAVPSGKSNTVDYRKTLAISIQKTDELFAGLSNKAVNHSKNWAALQSEARRRRVNISEVQNIKQLQRAILKEASRNFGGTYGWEDEWQDDDKGSGDEGAGGGKALADVRKAILSRAQQEGDDNSEGEEEEVAHQGRSECPANQEQVGQERMPWLHGRGEDQDGCECPVEAGASALSQINGCECPVQQWRANSCTSGANAL